jgi:hypothetical protein
VAITNVLFAKFPLNMGGGDASGDGPMDYLSDTIKATIHTATYSPNQATNETKTDATNELSTAGGYTAGGLTLASKTYGSSSLVTTGDAADLSWPAFTNTFRYIVLWDDTPTSPADPLMALVDTGGTQTLSGTDLSVPWNVSGIWSFTVA